MEKKKGKEKKRGCLESSNADLVGPAGLLNWIHFSFLTWGLLLRTPALLAAHWWALPGSVQEGSFLSHLSQKRQVLHSSSGRQMPQSQLFCYLVACSSHRAYPWVTHAGGISAALEGPASWLKASPMASGRVQAAFWLWLDCGGIKMVSWDLPSESVACIEVPGGLRGSPQGCMVGLHIMGWVGLKSMGFDCYLALSQSA